MRCLIRRRTVAYANSGLAYCAPPLPPPPLPRSRPTCSLVVCLLRVQFACRSKRPTKAAELVPDERTRGIIRVICQSSSAARLRNIIFFLLGGGEGGGWRRFKGGLLIELFTEDLQDVWCSREDRKVYTIVTRDKQHRLTGHAYDKGNLSPPCPPPPFPSSESTAMTVSLS